MQLPDLPITAVLDQLRAALSSEGRAVLEAPPGAGKTTLVPLALLGEDWLGQRRIVMLEPRRLARPISQTSLARESYGGRADAQGEAER